MAQSTWLSREDKVFRVETPCWSLHLQPQLWELDADGRLTAIQALPYAPRRPRHPGGAVQPRWLAEDLVANGQAH